MNKVVVMIPTLNEAQGIGSTIQEIIKELENAEMLEDAEILVIDADSVDGTSQIAARLGARVLRQFPVGKGSAIAEGLRNISADTKWVAIIDGDYALPAVYIPRFIKVLEERKDVGMVTGRRPYGIVPSWYKPKVFLGYIKGRTANGQFRLQLYFQHHILVLVHHILNKVHMEDPLSGLRVVRYGIVEDFRPKSKGFDIEVELNHYVRRKGHRIIGIPIKIRGRLGEDKWGGTYLKHGFAIFKRMMTMAVEDLVAAIKSHLSQKKTKCCH